MSRRNWAGGAAVMFGVLALGCSATFEPAALSRAADEPKPAPKKEVTKGAGKRIFGLTKVHKVHITLSAKEWAKMQPAAPKFPFGKMGGPPKAPAKGADTHKAGGGFGMEFPWARADLTIEGKTVKNVGLRYKGNFTYLASSRALQRPIKIDFDHYEKGQRFLGLKKLNLNNGVTDLTKARESLSLAVFRAAGVPAPRTAFAEVTLSVEGKYDKELVGLYTLVEQVDKVFLKAHFGSGDGLLVKPEGLQAGLQHFGEDWKQYEPRYRPKGTPDKKQQKRLIDFTRLINQADDTNFRKEIGSYLDIDAFLRFLAVNALTANLDSFLGFGHNYFLYLRPDTNRFVFIPWDLDLSMGAWPPGGTPEQQLNLSIMRPHRGQNKLIDRLLAMKDTNEKYRKVLKEVTTNAFTKERMLKDLAAIEKATKEPLGRGTKAARERKEGPGGFGPGGGVFGQSVPPKMFIEKRTVAVADQLAGKTTGFIPPAGFGFGPPGGFGPPPLGQIMPRQWQDQLRLTDEQRKKFADLQREVERKAEALLTEEQKAQYRRMRGNQPGGPPVRPFGKP